jgi:hypothetical protein
MVAQAVRGHTAQERARVQTSRRPEGSAGRRTRRGCSEGEAATCDVGHSGQRDRFRARAATAKRSVRRGGAPGPLGCVAALTFATSTTRPSGLDSRSTRKARASLQSAQAGRWTLCPGSHRHQGTSSSALLPVEPGASRRRSRRSARRPPGGPRSWRNPGKVPAASASSSSTDAAREVSSL